MKNITKINVGANVLAFVGGLNWITVGATNFDIVDKLFGFASWLPPVVKVVAGVSIVYIAGKFLADKFF